MLFWGWIRIGKRKFWIWDKKVKWRIFHLVAKGTPSFKKVLLVVGDGFTWLKERGKKVYFKADFQTLCFAQSKSIFK